MIEKLLDISDDLYTIEIREGNTPIEVYCLDNFAGKKIKITINIEVAK